MNTDKSSKDAEGNSINPVLSAVFPLEKIREIALAHTKQILSEIGVADDEKTCYEARKKKFKKNEAWEIKKTKELCQIILKTV